MLLCLMCLNGLLLLLLREIFDWLWLIGVSAYAVLVIRGGGAPVRFLTYYYYHYLRAIGKRNLIYYKKLDI